MAWNTRCEIVVGNDNQRGISTRMKKGRKNCKPQKTLPKKPKKYQENSELNSRRKLDIHQNNITKATTNQTSRTKRVKSTTLLEKLTSEWIQNGKKWLGFKIVRILRIILQ
jgi:hypothetical protein